MVPFMYFTTIVSVLPKVSASMDTLLLISDPIISIDFVKLAETSGSSSLTTQEAITYLVNATLGPPTITLLYDIPNKSVLNITRQVLQLDNKAYYHNAIKYTSVTLPQEGDIVCEVTDKLGTYRKTKHIETGGRFLLYQAKKSG